MGKSAPETLGNHQENHREPQYLDDTLLVPHDDTLLDDTLLLRTIPFILDDTLLVG